MSSPVFLLDDMPVLVLNYDGWEDTFRTIEALEGYRVWLVDNGSTHNRIDEARARVPNLFVLQLPVNLGWAGGYNAAIREVLRQGYACAYLLNNDAVPQPGALEAARSVLLANADAAAVGSVILEGDGVTVWFDGDYHLPRVRRRLMDVPAGMRAANSINGAGFVLNLHAFEAVGPFCEDYFLYHEETDWSVRAHLAGWRMLVDGRSQVVHARQASDSGGNAAYYRVRNKMLMYRRGIVFGNRSRLATVVLSQLIDICRFPAKARQSAILGLIDGLRGRFGQRRTSRLQALAGGIAMLFLPIEVVRSRKNRE